MPRVRIMDPFGMCYEIATRSPGLLSRWFDEVLPHTFVTGRPGVDDFDILWPKAVIYPMWSWTPGPAGPHDPDWSCDSRAVGQVHEFRAKNGIEGLRELERLRQQTESRTEPGPCYGAACDHVSHGRTA